MTRAQWRWWGEGGGNRSTEAASQGMGAARRSWKRQSTHSSPERLCAGGRGERTCPRPLPPSPRPAHLPWEAPSPVQTGPSLPSASPSADNLQGPLGKSPDSPSARFHPAWSHLPLSPLIPRRWPCGGSYTRLRAPGEQEACWV